MKKRARAHRQQHNFLDTDEGQYPLTAPGAENGQMELEREECPPETVAAQVSTLHKTVEHTNEVLLKVFCCLLGPGTGLETTLPSRGLQSQLVDLICKAQLARDRAIAILEILGE